MANTKKLFVLVFLTLIALVVAALVATRSGEPRLTSSDRVPSQFVFISDQSEVFLGSSGELTRIVDLGDAVTATPLGRVESIEPIGQGQVFVGTCCELSDGRQLIVDIETGRVEFFPVTMRLPSVTVDGMALLSGGDEIRVEDLGALLAYENGVGVVAPGPSLLEAVNEEVLRPVALPMDRVAFVSDGVLTVADLDGEAVVQSNVAERSMADVKALTYDSRNDVLVALGRANEVQVIAPDTLELIDEWTLDEDAHSIGALDGWLLISGIDGSITGHRIDGAASVQLISSGSTAASWLPTR